MSLLSFMLPEYRQRVLGLLLLHPDSRYHVREIARLTNTVAGSLHRELSKLAKAQVLVREVSGHQVYYQANTNFPIYAELASILRKTAGMVDVLASALAPLVEKVEVAIVFGSVARGVEGAMSDVDVLVIGELSFVEVAAAFYPTQSIIKREINPKVYTRTEWKELLKNRDSFVQEILSKPKLYIIGTESDLE